MSIFEIILPTLGISCIGWALIKFNVISEGARSGISTLTFSILIPALLFKGMYEAREIEQLNILYLLSFYIPLIVTYFLSRYLFNKFLFPDRVQATVAGLSASYSNTVLVGIPVLLNYMGSEAILPAFVIISIHAGFLLTLSSYLVTAAEAGSMNLRSLAKAFYTSLRNPIIFSLLLGFIFNYFDIPLFAWLESVLSSLSKAALPVALIVLGSALASYKLSDGIYTSLIISLIKLVMLPALVYFLSHKVFSLSPILSSVAVILAAMPVGIMSYSFAENRKDIAPTVASSILLSTLLSIITIPLWLYVLAQ